jgi:thioesterase domain-containing protein/acyl carrier protein
VDPRLRILATGDLVSMSYDGLLEFKGRKDRQIKINGRRVEPAELETLLRSSPNVEDAAVIAISNEGLVAFVVMVPGMDATLHDLRQDLRMNLPAVLHPVRLHVIPKIQRLPSAKIDIISLRNEDLAFQENHRRMQKPENETSLPAGEVSAVVTRAWRKVLKQSACMPDQSWDEAGGDSLKFMRFVFELEEGLSETLSLELFRMDMRPAEIIESIERARRSPLHDTPSESTDDRRPTIFLMPGLTGDSPGLASFRAELMDYIRFVPIEYPNWPKIADCRCSIDDLAEAAFEQINAIAPHGAIRIAGYSLGGVVAFEVAQRLLANSRSITFFSILDTNISGHADDSFNIWRRIRRATLHVLNGTETFQERACRLVARHLSHPFYAPVLRKLAKLNESFLPNSIRFNLHMELCESLQMRALADWLRQRSKPRLALHALLFQSNEPRPDAPESLGWDDLFESLKIIRIDGDHHGMLRLPDRVNVCKRFHEVFRAAEQSREMLEN